MNETIVRVNRKLQLLKLRVPEAFQGDVESIEGDLANLTNTSREKSYKWLLKTFKVALYLIALRLLRFSIASPSKETTSSQNEVSTFLNGQSAFEFLITMYIPFFLATVLFAGAISFFSGTTLKQLLEKPFVQRLITLNIVTLLSIIIIPDFYITMFRFFFVIE